MHVEGLAVITATAGVLGGVAGSLLQARGKDQPGARSHTVTPLPHLNIRFRYVLKGMFLGAIASFVVPLFLSLSQSTLINRILREGDFASRDATPRSSLLIYLGFCLIVAVYYETFLSGVSKTLLSNLNEIKHNQIETKQEFEERIQEVTENIPQEVRARADLSATSSASTKADGNQALTALQVALLKAFVDADVTWRLSSTVARDVNLKPASTTVALDRLVEIGLLTKRRSKTYKRDVYALTGAGAAAVK